MKELKVKIWSTFEKLITFESLKTMRSESDYIKSLMDLRREIDKELTLRLVEKDADYKLFAQNEFKITKRQ